MKWFDKWLSKKINELPRAVPGFRERDRVGPVDYPNDISDSDGLSIQVRSAVGGHIVQIRFVKTNAHGMTIPPPYSTYLIHSDVDFKSELVNIITFESLKM